MREVYPSNVKPDTGPVHGVVLLVTAPIQGRRKVRRATGPDRAHRLVVTPADKGYGCRTPAPGSDQRRSSCGPPCSSGAGPSRSRRHRSCHRDLERSAGRVPQARSIWGSTPTIRRECCLSRAVESHGGLLSRSQVFTGTGLLPRSGPAIGGLQAAQFSWSSNLGPSVRLRSGHQSAMCTTWAAPAAASPGRGGMSA